MIGWGTWFLRRRRPTSEKLGHRLRVLPKPTAGPSTILSPCERSNVHPPADVLPPATGRGLSGFALRHVHSATPFAATNSLAMRTASASASRLLKRIVELMKTPPDVELMDAGPPSHPELTRTRGAGYAAARVSGGFLARLHSSETALLKRLTLGWPRSIPTRRAADSRPRPARSPSGWCRA